MRAAPLTLLKGGINRLRIKGGAKADSLYDLVNGYVSEAGTAVIRPGTTRDYEVDPDNTKGLMGYQNELHVFSHAIQSVPAGVVCHVLTKPGDDPNDPTLIKTIHFAAPFLGYIYVVAEFEDDTVYHFWLANGGVWQANHVYKFGDVVQASADTGLLYRATRATAANQTWAPGVLREVGDVVEPTVYNDFYYTVIAAVGAAPRSGTVEPAWPTEAGATVTESTEQDEVESSGTTTPPATEPPQNVTERYGKGAIRVVSS